MALWNVINAEGSLAVTQSIVVAVYGLDLVVTGPAIYVIHTVGVARVDKVVAVAGVHLVVAFAEDDLVVAVATPEVVVVAVALEVVLPAAPAPEAVGPAQTREVVGPGGPQKRIVAGGAEVRTFARASCPAKNAKTITTITVSKMYSRFIGLSLSLRRDCTARFLKTSSRDSGSRSLEPTMVGRSPMFGTCRSLKKFLELPQGEVRRISLLSTSVNRARLQWFRARGPWSPIVGSAAPFPMVAALHFCFLHNGPRLWRLFQPPPRVPRSPPHGLHAVR